MTAENALLETEEHGRHHGHTFVCCKLFIWQPVLSCKAGEACARHLQLSVALALGIAVSGFWLPVQLGFSP